MSEDDIVFRADDKFDLQLRQALIDERRLADIFRHGDISRVELKSESVQWEQTGNIAIEYERNGKPSGISTTQCGYWVHELKRDGVPLLYLMFPIDRLKLLCREAYVKGLHRDNAGDGRLSKVIILPLRRILL